MNGAFSTWSVPMETQEQESSSTPSNETDLFMGKIRFCMKRKEIAFYFNKYGRKAIICQCMAMCSALGGVVYRPAWKRNAAGQYHNVCRTSLDHPERGGMHEEILAAAILPETCKSTVSGMIGSGSRPNAIGTIWCRRRIRVHSKRVCFGFPGRTATGCR